MDHFKSILNLKNIDKKKSLARGESFCAVSGMFLALL